VGGAGCSLAGGGAAGQACCVVSKLLCCRHFLCVPYVLFQPGILWLRVLQISGNWSHLCTT
jgi:hypothetical protein